MFSTILNSKRKLWRQPIWILTAAVVLVGVFDLAQPAAAVTIKSLTASLLISVADFFGEALLVVTQYVITFSGFNNFIDAPVVQTGWVLTRDIANMFYVFVFLLIAFGTMLKSEEYNWKKLLPRLVLTALMVNFSRLIIGIMIDFSQVIMLTFVNGYAATGGGNFLTALQIDKVFSFVQQKARETKDLEESTMIGALLAAILLGVAMVVTAVFAVILLARIVVLWVLIVLSPLAFLLGTFPKGKTYYDEWWKKLTNQIIVGPVLAFFLWLALATVGSGTAFKDITDNNKTYQADLEQNKKINASFPSIGTTKIGEPEILGNYLVSIAILFAGLMVTQQLGVAGSGLAGGAASWMKSKATGLAKKAAIVAGAYAAPGLATKFALGLGVEKLGALGAGAAYKFAKEGVTNRVVGWWDKRKEMAMRGEGLGAGVIGGVVKYGLKGKAYRQYWEHEYEKKIKPKEAHIEEEIERKRLFGYARPMEQAAEAAIQGDEAKKYAHMDSADSFAVVAGELREAMKKAKAAGKAGEPGLAVLQKKAGAMFLMSLEKQFNDDLIGSWADQEETEFLKRNNLTESIDSLTNDAGNQGARGARRKVEQEAAVEINEGRLTEGDRDKFIAGKSQFIDAERDKAKKVERGRIVNGIASDDKDVFQRLENRSASLAEAQVATKADSLGLQGEEREKFLVENLQAIETEKKKKVEKRGSLVKEFSDLGLTVQTMDGDETKTVAASQNINGADTQRKYIEKVILGGGSQEEVNKAVGKMQGFLGLLPTDDKSADLAHLSRESRDAKGNVSYQLNDWTEVRRRREAATNKMEDQQRIKLRPHFEHSISSDGRITATDNGLAAAKRGGLQQRNANEVTRSASAMFLRTIDPKEIAFKREQNAKLGALVTNIRDLTKILPTLLDKTQLATNTNSLNKVGLDINAKGTEITKGTMQIVVGGRRIALGALKSLEFKPEEITEDKVRELIRLAPDITTQPEKKDEEG